MKEITACEICGNKKLNYLFEQEDKNLGISKKFPVFLCSNCNALFLNPQPAFKDLLKHYSSNKYYSYSKINLSTKTKLKIRLYEIYFNKEKNNLLLKLFF